MFGKYVKYEYFWLYILCSFCNTPQNYDNCYRFNCFERFNILRPYKYAFWNVLKILKISVANICSFHLSCCVFSSLPLCMNCKNSCSTSLYIIYKKCRYKLWEEVENNIFFFFFFWVAIHYSSKNTGLKLWTRVRIGVRYNVFLTE